LLCPRRRWKLDGVQTPSHLVALQARIHELKDLGGIIGLLSWDQETYLPPRAGPARAAQLSTLQGLYHQRLVAPEVGEWLERAEAEGEALSSDLRAMLRVFRHERDRAVKVPERLVRALAEAQSEGLAGWKEARAARRFAPFQPALERLLALRREQADAIGHGGERYDALLDHYEPGMTTERLLPVLERLRAQLVPLVDALDGAVDEPDPFAGRSFDPQAQWRFTVELLGLLGFDLEAGRQDRSIHPFTGGTHPTDVRLTTRIDPANPCPAVFGTLHECGHGLYEQGFLPEHHRTPLAAAPSMGLHESQSRLWENLIGRSLPFWRFLYPRLQAAFPGALGEVSLETFHRAINRVRRSPIRVEADEVTYNLHIVLRTTLELRLLRGELAVAQVAEAWNEEMSGTLGIRPRDDVEGVLQDIHWAWGELGYFPTYSLGNLYAASLLRAAERALPDLWSEVERGQLGTLREWLRREVHHQGFRSSAEERVRSITGRGLTDADFLEYLHTKYGPLAGRVLSAAAPPANAPGRL
jgi:carboxypeptidase Taq